MNSYLLELLEDSGDRTAEGNGIIAETNNVSGGARDAEESGSALLLERRGDFFGNHLELHFEIHQVIVE